MQNVNIATQIYAKISFDATIGQKKIIESLSAYFDDDDFSKIFILNGYAGTGKTTLIAALVGALKDLKVSAILLAPTGRAAKVLSQYCGCEAHTIHRRIYRQQTAANYESKFSLNINKEQDAVFIVDEVSMLSNSSGEGQAVFGSGSLLDDLVDYVRRGRRCRLILVGDSAQLPPVGDEYSPALDESAMMRYGEVEYSSLDDVVRQDSDSGILFNATLVRCMLENRIFEIPVFDLSYPDFRAIEGGELLERLEECYSMYGKDETIVITRSNKRANRYNEGIRRNVFGAEEEIESGDKVMIVKNNYHFTERMEQPPMSFIANGDMAQLRRIRRFEDLYGFRFASVELTFPDYDDADVECKILLDTLASESPSLGREDARRLMFEVEKDYMETANRRKRFDQIRENEYFNALQVKFGYAVTCHKAQGGQWSAVFVDRCLFGDEPMTRDMLRWLYTAITRATQRVYLVSFDERFF